MPNWDEIRKEWETSKITLAALAEKHDVKLGTLKSRKSREKWSRGATKKDATKIEKVATKKIVPKAEEILNDSTLDDWEETFCLEYLKHFNKTKAYKAARPDVSYQSANTLGPRLFAEVRIQKRLVELRKAKKEQLFIEGSDIDEQWMRQAFADITDFVEFGTEKGEVMLDEDNMPMFEDDGTFKRYKHSFVRLKQDSEVDGALIQEVKLGREGVSLKLYDKQKALQELAKRLNSENEIKTRLLQLQEEKLKMEIEKLQKGEGSTSKESEIASMLRKLAGEE